MSSDLVIAQHKNGYDLPHKVVIVHSEVKREYFPSEQQYITERDAVKYANVIASYVSKLGINTKLIPGDANLVESLKKYKPDVVLNLVDSFKGSEYLASIIPATLELLELPYTGAGILGQSLGNNKSLATELLQKNGIPVPRSQLFNSHVDYLNPELRFPLISKLNEIHGSVEIDINAISENEKHLRERIKYLINTYKQGVLVQEFIVGREMSAVLLEGLNKKVYIAERIFPESGEKYNIESFEAHWIENGSTIKLQKYEDPILREYVRKAFVVSDMADYGRFDVRIDNSGRYFFLDANSNPFLGPAEIDSTMGRILDLYDITFEETLKRLLINTVRDSQGKERLPFPKLK